MVVLQDFLEHADAGPLRDALYSGSTKLVEAAFVYQLVRKLHTNSPCCDFTKILYNSCANIYMYCVYIYMYIRAYVCVPLPLLYCCVCTPAPGG